MTSYQQHGFIIEELIKREADRHVKQGVVALPQITTRYTAKFDLPSHRDPYGQGTPTSVKTSRFSGQKTLVFLSDAVRIAGLCEVPLMRLMVALYEQRGQEKVFSEIREYLIEGEEWRQIMGGVPVEIVEDFHLALREPDHRKARVIARQWKEKLADEFPCSMRWNPKIDSKNQRRLQCSVRLEDIEAAIVDKSRIRVFGEAFKQPASSSPRPAYLRPGGRRLWGDGVSLPFSIPSPPRPRVRNADKPQSDETHVTPPASRRRSRSMVQ